MLVPRSPRPGHPPGPARLGPARLGSAGRRGWLRGSPRGKSPWATPSSRQFERTPPRRQHGETWCFYKHRCILTTIRASIIGPVHDCFTKGVVGFALREGAAHANRDKINRRRTPLLCCTGTRYRGMECVLDWYWWYVCSLISDRPYMSDSHFQGVGWSAVA